MERIWPILTLLGTLAAAGAGALWHPGQAQAAPEELRARGKGIYDAACARCHGPDGSDVTLYPNVKSLVDITQRATAREVIEQSKAFAGLALEGQEGAALLAYLETFRSGKWANPELLVETSWVALHLDDPKVRLVDLRSAEAYAAGHIPGAVRIEEGPLRNPDDPLEYLPTPESFAAMMEKAGIGNDTRVVCYDDQGGRSAARLWFVLHAYGHEAASLLNGGWLKWTAEKRPTTSELPRVAPAKFIPKKIPEAVCAFPELLARKPDVVVLDTRSEAEFRAGRIPNAVRVEWREAVTGPHLVFKSGPELRKLYESRGITPDRQIVSY